MLNDLLESGLRGTLLLLTVAVCAFGWVGADLVLTGGYFPALLGLGIGALIAAPVPLVIRLKEGPRLIAPRPTKPTAELLATLSALPKPFWLCTQCVRTTDGPMCQHCGQFKDVLEIRHDADLSIVFAGLERG